MSTSTQWLVQIKQICTQVGIQHVDLLLDQTAWHNYALPGLRQINPPVPGSHCSAVRPKRTCSIMPRY